MLTYTVQVCNNFLSEIIPENPELHVSGSIDTLIDKFFFHANFNVTDSQWIFVRSLCVLRYYVGYMYFNQIAGTVKFLNLVQKWILPGHSKFIDF